MHRARRRHRRDAPAARGAVNHCQAFSMSFIRDRNAAVRAAQTMLSASGDASAPAPTRSAQPAAPARKNKVRVLISIDPDLLSAVDTLARDKGLSRAGTMSLACAEFVKRDRQESA
ncbi:ribbon-helix-helix domain-containing protein [Burkholderia pseudomallei]|uniref:ribbon-helix-helix domain-containing protein n=1 Tax=Burkholderia pseudomallei TaxID=28450 RepID=UPI000B287E24|nr:CopG family transcriptional regulator [Burkholderia pseudomallei]